MEYNEQSIRFDYNFILDIQNSDGKIIIFWDIIETYRKSIDQTSLEKFMLETNNSYLGGDRVEMGVDSRSSHYLASNQSKAWLQASNNGIRATAVPFADFFHLEFLNTM